MDITSCEALYYYIALIIHSIQEHPLHVIKSRELSSIHWNKILEWYYLGLILVIRKPFY